MSSFFRNLYQYRALRQVLDRIFERDPSRPIRIWVPGCSDGREAYSIAMLVREDGQHLSRKIEILGTDISRNAIMAAAQGIYRHLDGRKEAGLPADEDRNGDLLARYQQMYFEPVRGDLFAVAGVIKQMVRFRVDDLLRSNLKGKYDIISCHNVLMHLSDAERISAALFLLEMLREGGFLATNDPIFKVCDNLSRLPVEENTYGYTAYRLRDRADENGAGPKGRV